MNNRANTGVFYSYEIEKSRMPFDAGMLGLARILSQ